MQAQLDAFEPITPDDPIIPAQFMQLPLKEKTDDDETSQIQALPFQIKPRIQLHELGVTALVVKGILEQL